MTGINGLTPDPRAPAGRAAWLARFGVPPETAARLDAMAAALTRWQAAINLVAPASLPHLWTRHVADSLQLWALAPETARTWADLGAGAGFPGLVIAALAADRRPALSVALVESDARKCAFLAEAARAMGVTVDIQRRRIEAAPPRRYDVVSARALAPLDRLCGFAATHLAEGGVALFPKGADVERELTAAAPAWQYRLTRTASLTDPAGVVLTVTELRRADSVA
jgi:16S rRNA (guanine527-N7)-methyltransferase